MPVLMATCLLIGCAGGTGVAPNSQTTTRTPAPAVTSTLSSVGSVDFGNISVGATKTDPLVLSNQTTDGSNITVSAISVAGTGFTLSSVLSLPQTLGAGQSMSLDITFAPLSAGAASGSISVSSNAANPTVSVLLSGDGQFVAGQLMVSPATLNFGNVAVGSNTPQTGALIAGGTSITISSAAWSGPGYSVSGITFPVTVPANQSVPFTVTFAPESAGSAGGSVSFLSNATNSPAVESFTGDGTQTSTQYTVSLSWDPSTSNVTGYNVYRATQSGGPYVKLTSSPQPGTSYTDSVVQDGSTYFYVSTSVNSAGEESSYSNQATAAIP
jgi:hypothetical protein